MTRLHNLPAACLALLLATNVSVLAQAITPPAAPPPPPSTAKQPPTFGDMIVLASVRARSYSWDWFGRTGGEYTYPATLVRLGFLLSCLLPGPQVLLYILLWVVIPAER